MADKRIIELANEKLLLSDGDMTIVDSESGTYKYDLNRLAKKTITDTTLSVEGKPADAKATGDQIADVKSDLGDIDATIKDYLAESNKLYGQASFTVGVAGQTFQRKTFYTLEKTFSSGERYTFTCDSIVGNTAIPMRFELFSGTTKIRDGGQSQVLYLQIEDSDISVG